MEVKLIQISNDPWVTMYIAARTCYSSKGPCAMSEEDYDFDKMYSLVSKVLKSGHTSIAEHVNLTFAIDGISRACSHQLVRHRHCTFSQQSQRYVDMSNVNFIKPDGVNEEHFDRLTDWFKQQYHQMKVVGLKNEDARALLPNCTSTSLVMTCNLRQLMHMSELRLCTRAQKEIRTLFSLIKKTVAHNDKRLAELLLSKCDRLGFCTEENCCGKRMQLSGSGQ